MPPHVVSGAGFAIGRAPRRTRLTITLRSHTTYSMAISADHVFETFGTATEENQISALREHQVVKLPAEGEVWVVGDIHDHTRNFEKFIRPADLANNPQRHVVLQELIHVD